MRPVVGCVLLGLALLPACHSPLDINTPRQRTVPDDAPDSLSLVNGFRVSLALTFDESGSMQGFGNQTAKAGALRLCDYLDGTNDEAEVICFNQTVFVQTFMTTQIFLLRAGISSLQPNGNTALWDAALLSVRELVNNGRNRRAVIIFSDGEDNASSSGDQLAFISSAVKSNVSVSTIAFGAAAPVDKLKQVADSTGGRFESVTTSAEAEAAYLRILRDLRRATKGI